MIDYQELTDLDMYIFRCYTAGNSYQETQRLILENKGIDLSGRKLSYRVDTLRKKFDCATQLQLGYKYAMATLQLQENQHKYDLKQVKKNSIEKGLAIGSAMWLITILLIWYFQMWH